MFIPAYFAFVTLTLTVTRSSYAQLPSATRSSAFVVAHSNSNDDDVSHGRRDPPSDSWYEEQRLDAVVVDDDDGESSARASQMAPTSDSRSQFNEWTPIIRPRATTTTTTTTSSSSRGGDGANHERSALMRNRNSSDGVKRERTGSPRQSRTVPHSWLYAKVDRASGGQRDDDGQSTAAPHVATTSAAGRRVGHVTERRVADAATLSEEDIMRMHYGPVPDASSPSLSPLTSSSSSSYRVREEDVENGDDPFATPTSAYRPPDERRRTPFAFESVAVVPDVSTVRGRNPPALRPRFAHPRVGALQRPSSSAAELDGPHKRHVGRVRPADPQRQHDAWRPYKSEYDDRIVPGRPDETSAPNALRTFSGQLVNGVDAQTVAFKRILTADRRADAVAADGADISANLVHTDRTTEQSTASATSSASSASSASSSSSSSAPAHNKLGRHFDKPIVIVEPQTTTSLTPEYYRQLFDSFSSGHSRRSDVDQITANKKSLSSAAPGWRAANVVTESVSKATFEEANVAAAAVAAAAAAPKYQRNIDDGRRRNETKQKDTSFFSISMQQFKELVPKTLRKNLLAINRVLIDCYVRAAGDNHQNEPSSVNCLKKITFDILDKAIDSDVVRLTDTVSLIKENKTSWDEGRSASTQTTDESEWLPIVIGKIQKLFSSHALKVKLMNSQEPAETFQVEGRRRHYRRVFPIMVGAYMILSSLLIPLGFKFMALLGTKSILLSKLSLIIALMGGMKKFMGGGGPMQPSLYPSPYPSFYPSYFDPWRRDEYRKISQHFDDPLEYSHFTEELE